MKANPEHLYPQVAVVPLTKQFQEQEVCSGHQMQQAGDQDEEHSDAKGAIERQIKKQSGRTRQIILGQEVDTLAQRLVTVGQRLEEQTSVLGWKITQFE